LAYVKKHNEQVKRWEDAKKKRVEKGLPEVPPEQDSSMLKAKLEAMNANTIKKVLPQKAFVPEIV
jgi:predicted secreted Zn-dependent protease